MAVVNPTPEIPQRIERIRYPVVDTTGMMGSRGEIVEEMPPRVIEDKLYVAVGKDVKENQLTLRWALHNSGGRKICLLHVHQPADRIPMLGTKFRKTDLDEHQVKSYHEMERQNMHQLLEKYCQLSQKSGVRVEKLHIEMESIEQGIIELILQHDVRRLVMGAAADKLYSKKMMEPKSKKAIYVRLQAPSSCHIWFICKGNLIYTREGKRDGLNVGSPLVQAISTTETGLSSSSRSRSITEGQSDREGLRSPATNYRRVMSDNHGINISTFSSPDVSGRSTPHIRSNTEGAFDEWNGIPRIGSRASTSSSSEVIMYAIADRSELELDYNSTPVFKENIYHSSPPSVLQERSMNDELYDQLVQAMAEADSSKRDAYEESMKRRKAEKDAIEAVRRIKASEKAYGEELRRRREVEEALAIGKEEHAKIKQQLDEVVEELRVALEHKSSLEVERDDALRQAEELKENQKYAASSSSIPQHFCEFSFSEIEEATRNFDAVFKIGEGGYGSIYRSVLRHTEVAIKILNTDSRQGPSEFQQEVNVLSKLRHPNLITLIGACPEAWILVYEYLSGGSLEDRLNCKDNAPPLSWQTRIRIAAELCSVLSFLHSCGIVHGDLKPGNLLLDGNLVSKLSDFGICRIFSQEESSSNNTTLCWRTCPKGTPAYIDPEFLSTGELTSKSDVYSFGIILLRLLTGRPPFSLAKDVQFALDNGTLKNILDPAAGDWPFIQAKQLAHLGLNCCEVTRKFRPDLASDVWRVLEPMRVSCGFSSFRFGPEGQCQIPHYFICPIFQEIMQDPVVAADGFTYEAEALKGWLDGGHNTSPMTNCELEHTNLVPNHALRSAIQEWLQHT